MRVRRMQSPPATALRSGGRERGGGRECNVLSIQLSKSPSGGSSRAREGGREGGRDRGTGDGGGE